MLISRTIFFFQALGTIPEVVKMNPALLSLRSNLTQKISAVPLPAGHNASEDGDLSPTAARNNVGKVMQKEISAVLRANDDEKNSNFPSL